MKFLIYISIFLFSFETFGQKSDHTSRASDCTNFIQINGKTNLNNFFLEQNIRGNYLCGPGNSEWMYQPELSKYEMRIPVSKFEANNPFVYHDFLSLIRASEYPYIRILIDEDDFQNIYSNKNSFNSDVQISLAGVTKTFSIECMVTACNYPNMIISGTKIIKLTDFKLDPPEKSFGLIKVKNELSINFEFKLPDNLITKVPEN